MSWPRIVVARIVICSLSPAAIFHTITPYDEAVMLDNRVISELEQFNPEIFIMAWKLIRLKPGGGPIAGVINAARQLGATKRDSLLLCSGDVTGDKSGVVGYLPGLLFLRE